jgi:hypothetical protein
MDIDAPALANFAAQYAKAPTSARILDKVVTYGALHEIKDLDNLRRRLRLIWPASRIRAAIFLLTACLAMPWARYKKHFAC